MLLVSLCATPAFAGGNSDFLFFLSADYLVRNSLESSALDDSDFTPTVDLLYSYNNGPWRILGEYFATDDEAELERLQFGLDLSADSTIWVGRFHQPISVWNHQYHHGAYLQPGISRPAIENWEDNSGVLPAHVTGFMFDGWQPLSENSGLRIAASVGLGPDITVGELLPFDLVDPGDTDGRLAGGIDIAYFPDYVAESNFGLLGGYAEIVAPPNLQLGNLSNITIRQKMIGVHGNWESGNWHLIGAAYYVDNTPNDTSVMAGGYFVAGYLQALYEFDDDNSLYSRVERTRNPESPYLQLFPEYVHQRELIGYRWDFAEKQALHIEASSNRIVGDKFSALQIQWSAAFP